MSRNNIVFSHYHVLNAEVNSPRTIWRVNALTEDNRKSQDAAIKYRDSSTAELTWMLKGAGNFYCTLHYTVVNPEHPKTVKLVNLCSYNV